MEIHSPSRKETYLAADVPSSKKGLLTFPKNSSEVHIPTLQSIFVPNFVALGLYFHIVGEGVVRLSDRGSGSSHNDKENYIDFRMKLLGESNGRAGGKVFWI
ncbi:hypothetical protein AVEN_82420-1 [Araneus ventricosus]|uniref:Uncharacterized protein n=1 Tax=Araneus ventricosus TaxID=182803 RepID=A0A4Y2VXN7_ARAVE|nr:hypothetical protein AVEN_82420-1 [Araneus ventricosus]